MVAPNPKFIELPINLCCSSDTVSFFNREQSINSSNAQQFWVEYCTVTSCYNYYHPAVYQYKVNASLKLVTATSFMSR